MHRIFISLYTVSFRSNKVKCRKEEKQPKRYEEVIVDIECFLNENETGDFDFDLNDEFIVDNEESSLNNVLFDDDGEEGNWEQSRSRRSGSTVSAITKTC